MLSGFGHTPNYIYTAFLFTLGNTFPTFTFNVQTLHQYTLVWDREMLTVFMIKGNVVPWTTFILFPQ